MASLILALPLPEAAPAVHVEVAMGAQPMLGVLRDTDLPTLVRAEVGSRLRAGTVYGVVQLSYFNAAVFSDGSSASTGLPALVPGDGSFTELGVGFRHPWQWGAFVLSLEGNAYTTHFSVPMAPAARAEFEEDNGATATGFTSWGGAVELDVGAAVEIVPGQATVGVAQGLGYASNPGVGVLLPFRLMVGVRF